MPPFAGGAAKAFEPCSLLVAGGPAGHAHQRLRRGQRLHRRVELAVERRYGHGDPLGLLIELASYRFEPPHGHTHADVLLEAHKIRVEREDYNIAEEHLADAIETLVRRSRASLSEDRSPQDSYH